MTCTHCGREIRPTEYGTWADARYAWSYEVCELSDDDGPDHAPCEETP
jgi:hypothetical protein